MTLYEFRLLTSLFQLQYVVTAGTYLAHRWESAQHRVNFYHLEDGGRGFFAEVGYDEALAELRVLRSFRSSVPLEGFTHRVLLPTGGRRTCPKRRCSPDSRNSTRPRQ